MKYHQAADYAKILKRIRLLSGTIHTHLGVYVFLNVQIQTSMTSYSTDGYTNCMNEAVNTIKAIR